MTVRVFVVVMQKLMNVVIVVAMVLMMVPVTVMEM
jgi:hypothetical protein